MASDERWRVHSVTPTDKNRLCPMLIHALCYKLTKLRKIGLPLATAAAAEAAVL